MALRIAGGRVIDPANGINDEVRDLYSLYSAEQDGTLRSALASVVGSLKPEAKTVEARILSFPTATQPLP